MNGPADNLDSVTNPLRIDRCPDCGYLFTGLPENGRCPECGFAYNEEMIILYGWAFLGSRRQQGETPRSHRLNLVVWILLAATGVYLLYRGLSLPWQESWWAILVPVLAILQAGWQSWCHGLPSHSLTEAPAPLQVRIQPEGFAQRNGIGRVRLRPWRRDLLLEMRMADSRHCRLRIGHHWLGLGVYVAAVEFKGDTTAAETIRRRIQQWCPTVTLR